MTSCASGVLGTSSPRTDTGVGMQLSKLGCKVDVPVTTGRRVVSVNVGTICLGSSLWRDPQPETIKLKTNMQMTENRFLMFMNFSAIL